MILLSFSSAEDALTNDVKEYDRFSLQGTENLPFRNFENDCFFFFFFFFWGGGGNTRYSLYDLTLLHQCHMARVNTGMLTTLGC